MTSKQIFFSYSRDDGAFALRLATDLRDAGANIWIDQLNIRAGSRWDAEVEKALKAAGVVLLVLSPSSVASNNVMDELSFALDEKKELIPVIYRPCEIPFRIRRLQHIDFSGDYDESLEKLLDNLEQENTPSGTDAGQTNKLTSIDDRHEQEGIRNTGTTYTEKSRSLRLTMLGLAILLLLGAATWLFSSMGEKGSHDEAEILNGNRGNTQPLTSPERSAPGGNTQSPQDTGNTVLPIKRKTALIAALEASKPAKTKPVATVPSSAAEEAKPVTSTAASAPDQRSQATGLSTVSKGMPRSTAGIGAGVLKGYVYDRVSGSPVPGAQVCWIDHVSVKHCATTDRTGYFLLSDLPSGSYRVSAGSEGYRDTTLSRTFSGMEGLSQNFQLSRKPGSLVPLRR